MPQRQQSQQSAKNNAARGFVPPSTEDELLHSTPAAEVDSSPLVQRAQTNPSSLTARQVLQLQRTIGNRAVNNLIARKTAPRPAPIAIQREAEAAEDDTLVGDHDSDVGLETAIAREIESVPADAVQRGFFSRTKKSKGNADQGATNEVTQTGLAGLTAGGLYLSVSRAIDLIKGAKAAGGAVFKSALGEVGNLLRGMAVPGFLSLIKHIYDAITTYVGMQGLKDAFENLKAKEQNAALTPDEVKLKEAAGHGFAKVRRRFYLKVYHIVSAIVKITAHFITVLSGGTAAMVSELVAIGASVLEGIQKLYAKGKGFYKWLVNKRGKHRKESADTIVDLGLAKDQNALKILIDLDAYSTLRDIKKGLVHGHGGVDSPTNPTEMYNLLVTFRDDPDKYGSLEEYKKDVMKKLKSQ